MAKAFQQSHLRTLDRRVKPLSRRQTPQLFSLPTLKMLQSERDVRILIEVDFCEVQLLATPPLTSRPHLCDTSTIYFLSLWPYALVA
jgi:hypothetical protein